MVSLLVFFFLSLFLSFRTRTINFIDDSILPQSANNNNEEVKLTQEERNTQEKEKFDQFMKNVEEQKKKFSAISLNNKNVKVQALYNFDARGPEELSLKEGDVINVLEQDKEMWKGELNGNTGYFPLSYVKEIQEEKEENQKKEIKAVAIYDFNGIDDTELSFKIGDQIKVLSMEDGR